MRSLRIAVPGAVVLIVLLLVTGVLAPAMPEGLPATPLLTLLLVPVLRTVMFASGALAVGAAFAGGLLGTDAGMRRVGARAAVAFAATSVFLAVATLADVMAVQWWRALSPSMLFSFLTQIDEGRYLMLQAVLAASAALVLQRIEHGVDATFAFLLLLVAACLPGFTGHSTAAIAHWLVSGIGVIHLAAMMIWVGTSLALFAVPLRSEYQRFSRYAALPYLVIVLSGVASVFARVSSWSALVHDRYALVLLGKALLALAAGGLAHRAAARVGTAEDHSDGAIRIAIARHVAVMLVVLAFAVALARLANP